MQRKTTVLGLLAVLLGALVSAFGVRGDEVRGMISARAGDKMIVNGSGGKKTVIILTANTRTKDDKGLFGLDKEEMADAVLIPGLKVRIEGTRDSERRLVAKTITVDGDDLETSQMIEAGLQPTAEQVAANVVAIENNRQGVATNQQNITANQQNIAANKQAIATHTEQINKNINDIRENTDRFNRLDDYNVKAEATVKFKVSSSTMSKEDKEDLKKLADTAKGLDGYIVEVKGFTDSSGSAAMNDKLSEDRAKAVVRYLMRECNVPVWRIVAPAAMGEFQPSAANETATGRAENRRVEVKVLINKGVAGS